MTADACVLPATRRVLVGRGLPEAEDAVVLGSDGSPIAARQRRLSMTAFVHHENVPTAEASRRTFAWVQRTPSRLELLNGGPPGPPDTWAVAPDVGSPNGPPRPIGRTADTVCLVPSRGLQ